MYLIVGLGNHGDKYTYTRHNVGFLCVDAFVKKLETSFSYQSNIEGSTAEIRDTHEKYILLKPHTYMNHSGDAVARAEQAYHVPKTNRIIISDDANLEMGVVRIRFGGEDGGHNGLKSVSAVCGPDYWRIRIGIGTPPDRVPLEAWVLGGLSEDELKGLHKTFDTLFDKYFTNGVHLKEETVRIEKE